MIVNDGQNKINFTIAIVTLVALLHCYTGGITAVSTTANSSSAMCVHVHAL
jgi:hypothetical protein